MQKLILPAAILVAFASAATAETRLDRFEAISEASNNLMLAGLVDMAVSEGADRATLEAMLPSFEWDDAMREAGNCMMAAYDAEIGTEGVDEMMNRMETFIQDADGMSFDELSESSEMFTLPEGLSEDRSIEITDECGMLDLQLAWMGETGFMDALMSAAAGN